MRCSLCTAQGSSPAEGRVCYFLLSAKAFCSASACQGNPAKVFVTLDDSYKAISVIAYRIDLIFIACQHRQNNNSDCQKKIWGGIYHHKIQTKRRTALLYYAFIVVTLQKDTDFYNYIYKPPVFPLSYVDINTNDGNIFYVLCYAVSMILCDKGRIRKPGRFTE